jgi:hypothetical protein
VKDWDVLASVEFFLSEEVSGMLKEITADTFSFYTWYSSVLKIALYRTYIHVFNANYLSEKSIEVNQFYSLVTVARSSTVSFPATKRS